jgi:hypothetical protein
MMTAMAKNQYRSNILREVRRYFVEPFLGIAQIGSVENAMPKQ